MKHLLSTILCLTSSYAFAGNLELGIGTGVDSSYETKDSRISGKRNNYSLGYVHHFTDSLGGAVTLGRADFEGLKDSSVRFAPRFYYGNLFATAGFGYHHIEQQDAYTGLLGLGFRTHSESGKVAYGLDLIQERGFGDRKFNQLDLSLLVSVRL